MRRLRCIVGALPAVLWIAPLLAQQPTGTLRGRITVAASQQPLAGATISVGTHRALSQGDGRYVVAAGPAGPDSLRARRFGYAGGGQRVTVGGGVTRTV